MMWPPIAGLVAAVIVAALGLPFAAVPLAWLAGTCAVALLIEVTRSAADLRSCPDCTHQREHTPRRFTVKELQ